MNPRLRRLGVLLLLPMVLLLSSCMKLEMTTVIKSEKEIQVSMTVTYDKAKMKQLGGQMPTKEELCKADEGSSFKKAKSEPFEDDKSIGCKLTGTMTLAEYNEGGDGPQINLNKDVWTFTMKGDTGSTQGGQISKEMFDGFLIKFTFPGKVLSHSGSSTVDGNTVTWTDVNDLLTGGGLSATGKNGGGIPTWAWFAIGAVVLAAIGGGVFGVLSASKKKKAAAAAAAGYGGYGPGAMGGYGQPDPYGQQYPPQQNPQQQFDQQQYGPQQYGQQQYGGQDPYGQGQPPAQQYSDGQYGQPSADQWGQSQPSAGQWTQPPAPGQPGQQPGQQWGQGQQPPQNWGGPQG